MPEQDSAFGGKDEDNRDLGKLGRMWARGIALATTTTLPGRVVSVDAGVLGQKPTTVRVQPSISIVIDTPDGQSTTTKPLPAVPAAVVGFYQSGSFAQSAPVQPGDQGWLIIAHRSIEAWRRSSGEPTEPPFAHTHNLADALFLPVGPPGGNPVALGSRWSLRTHTGAGPGAEPGEISMGVAGDVEIAGPTVGLGRGAVIPVARVGDGVLASPAFIAWCTQMHVWATAAHSFPLLLAYLSGLPIPVVPPPIPPLFSPSEAWATVGPTAPSIVTFSL